ncbi:MAG: hypothetical protein JWM09_1346 [Francisellaceae bacterium]|nr:hypothetical protein [Francisellaceae bacterium]
MPIINNLNYNEYELAIGTTLSLLVLNGPNKDKFELFLEASKAYLKNADKKKKFMLFIHPDKFQDNPTLRDIATSAVQWFISNGAYVNDKLFNKPLRGDDGVLSDKTIKLMQSLNTNINLIKTDILPALKTISDDYAKNAHEVITNLSKELFPAPRKSSVASSTPPQFTAMKTGQIDKHTLKGGEKEENPKLMPANTSNPTVPRKLTDEEILRGHINKGF